jgi:S1-C subfamily serine protease
MKLASAFTTSLLGVLAGAAIVGGVVWARDDSKSASNRTSATSQNSAQNVSSARSNAASDASTDLTALYDKVRPSIVRITTGTSGSDPFSQQSSGIGSGIVLDKEGHILTNYHVVTGFDTVTVTFSDGTTGQAEVVGKDPGDDTAIVKVSVDDPNVLTPATLGDSSQVKVGIGVAAIGNPFGLDGTFTTGVISGLDRTLQSSGDGRPIRGLLQTDAAVNPGNSGGALINMHGEVIGINTAIVNPGGDGFAGVAYAVPINTPKRYLARLTSGETVNHARLGIAGRTLTKDDTKNLSIAGGVAVMSVEPGSSADKAGLKASSNGNGDVIVALDGTPISKFEDVADYIDTKAVGDNVKVTVHRDGKNIELTATLQSWDSSA